MYSISGYGKMIADGVRMQAYTRAIRQAVNPDSVILDIGTGVGIFALLADHFRARRVYAIEPDDAIQVAREIAANNDIGSRIIFIQDLSTRATLPERVDVIVSDLRGVLPLFRHHISSIADARKRFLAPGGALIPQSDTLWAALVETPDLYNEHLMPWGDNIAGLNVEAARRIAINIWRKGRVALEQLLTEPRCWATLDYATIEDPDVGGQVTWKMERVGTGHGLSVWFDTTLVEGVGFSNKPGEPELIYGTAFFPWIEPVSLATGDRIEVTLHADLVGEDYLWRWDTRVKDDNGRVKADFKQSTLYGTPISPARLRKRADSYVPAITQDGEIDRFILSLMDGLAPQGDIARRVMERFPARFAKWQDALTRVGELSQKYSR
jgi:type I protein arginine methyltransferase